MNDLELIYRPATFKVFEKDYLFDLLETFTVRLFQSRNLSRSPLTKVVNEVCAYARTHNIDCFVDQLAVSNLFDIISGNGNSVTIRYRVNRLIIDELNFVKVIGPQFW